MRNNRKKSCIVSSEFVSKIQYVALVCVGWEISCVRLFLKVKSQMAFEKVEQPIRVDQLISGLLVTQDDNRVSTLH